MRRIRHVPLLPLLQCCCCFDEYISTRFIVFPTPHPPHTPFPNPGGIVRDQALGISLSTFRFNAQSCFSVESVFYLSLVIHSAASRFFWYEDTFRSLPRKGDRELKQCNFLTGSFFFLYLRNGALDFQKHNGSSGEFLGSGPESNIPGFYCILRPACFIPPQKKYYLSERENIY